MSALGSKADIRAAKGHVRFAPNSDRKSGYPHKVVSALPPTADMCSALAHVCFGPKADMCGARVHVCFGPIADKRGRNWIVR
jgi:hypothetical protein